jgi:O-antigen ligase
LAGVVGQKRWDDLKRIALPAVLLLLPVAAYAQSIHYAIDKPYAKGATKLLLVVALKALCFFVLLYENRGLWKVVKSTVYGVTAIIVVFGFFQFIFDVLGASPRITDLRPCCTSNSTYIFPRVHSVALEPLYFANFLLLPLWLMVHDFIFNKAARRNKVLLILLAATSSLFILSLARSALLGLLVSALVFMVGLGGSSLKKAAPHVLRGAGLILIIALGFIILSGVASKHIHKTAINGSTSGVKGNLGIFGSHAVSVADESAQTRYSTWPKAIDYFKENPIKGIGAYNSRVRLNLEQYRKGAPDVNLQPFNNDFLGLLVDLGLIGVLAFGPLVAGVLVSLIKSFKRRWATPSAAYALASLAMLIQTNFFQSILLARLWVVTGIALAGIYSLPAKRKVST